MADPAEARPRWRSRRHPAALRRAPRQLQDAPIGGRRRSGHPGHVATRPNETADDVDDQPPTPRARVSARRRVTRRGRAAPGARTARRLEQIHGGAPATGWHSRTATAPAAARRRRALTRSRAGRGCDAVLPPASSSSAIAGRHTTCRGTASKLRALSTWPNSTQRSWTARCRRCATPTTASSHAPDSRPLPPRTPAASA